MRSWKDIDWAEPRPSPQDVAASWGELVWEPVPIDSEAVSRYLDQVRETHTNGGVLVGRWRAVSYDAVTAWFAVRNRLEEYELHRVLFDSPVVRRDLAPLQIPTQIDRVPGELEEVAGGALTLDGILATKIVQGGAYRSFAGTAAEAKRLADEAVVALTGRRYEDFRLDQTFRAWTPWFYDIAWDHTLVLTDYGNAEVVALCVTDTD